MEKKDILKKELKELVLQGHHIKYYAYEKTKKATKEESETLKKNEKYQNFIKQVVTLNSSYQSWYSKAIQIISQLLPSRLDEFKQLYINEKRNIKDITYLNYGISDYFLGLSVTQGWDKQEVVNPFSAFSTKMEVQIQILNSCLESIDYKLMNIEGVLQSELFESELETAKDLLKKKHIRLSGALAGITLEIHLKKVCINHGIKFRKANPTITDSNEELKSKEIIDVPTWRLIQRLGDIRNLCVHSKDREPSHDEIEDLIKGTEKLIAELF